MRRWWIPFASSTSGRIDTSVCPTHNQNLTGVTIDTSILRVDVLLVYSGSFRNSGSVDTKI